MELLSRERDGTVFRLRDTTGELCMTRHGVFSGISLVYNDGCLSRCCAEHSPPGCVLEINHCREGRMEQQREGAFWYVAAGDLSIGRREAETRELVFPTGHYRGITVLIDTDRTPACLSCLLEDVRVQPAALLEKFCGDGSCFIMRFTPRLEHVFSELYEVPDAIRKGYLKVKVLELLLFLSGVVPEPSCTQRCRYTKTQVQLAKQVCGFIGTHLDTPLTIEGLARYFHVSPTQLKSSFKGVYGVSVYVYIRAERMRAAARLLARTDRTVLDIAGQYGYENGSKFARAFREVMGVTPKAYRQRPLAEVQEPSLFP